MLPIPTNIGLSKANQYIYADKLKEKCDEFIKENGTLVGKVRGYFNDIETYIYMH